MHTLKTLCFLLMTISVWSCEMSRVMVPANDQVELELESPNGFIADLRNRSSQQVEIAVIHKDDGRQVSGFGLNKGGESKVTVDQGCHLVISNEHEVPAKVAYTLSPKPASNPDVQKRTYVSFTLANTSNESIPLLIPSVMNPNLSPNSESGVDLAIGQEVLFKSGMKKYVLLVVDESIENGAVIDAAELLRKRKVELGL